MLQIFNGVQIATDDYFIRHKQNGVDELQFSVLLSDPAYRAINEEDTILETTEQQKYIVKKIAGGKTYATITCDLDLSDWDSILEIGYSRRGSRAFKFLDGFRPADWTVIDGAGHQDEPRSIIMDGPTPRELAMQVQKDYGCAVRFDTSAKTATIVWPEDIRMSNSYAIDTVNLRRVPEYKGKSTGLFTRIYPIGRNPETGGNLRIDGGYLDAQNPATDRVICALWKDYRYTDQASLKADAQAMVNAAAQPERSWELDVIDLQRIDPVRWPDMSLSLFTVLLLVDNYKGIRTQVQVVEDKVYPYYPEKNKITVSNRPASVQRTLLALTDAINNPNSEWAQKLTALIGG